MGNVVKGKRINSLFNRKNLINLRIKDFIQELYVYFFELRVIYQVIEKLQNFKLQEFDALVGDRKCQTRASIILDLLKNISLKETLESQKNHFKILLNNTLLFIQEVSHYNHAELQELSKKLNQLSLIEYLEYKQLTFLLNSNLRFFSLCYVTILPKYKLQDLSYNKISSSKLEKLLVIAKMSLCEISIQYEQDLAKKYTNKEVQTALQQINTKSFVSMTACFPGFKAILEKIKKEERFLLIKTIFFCKCHKIQNEQIQLFVYQQNYFKEVPIDEALEQVVLVVEAYQYPGSFVEFKTTFNIDKLMTRLPKKYYTSCNCLTPSSQKPTENLEQALLAFFAQHPQFTDDKINIDFKGLGLENSELQKEYEYLKGLKGFSIDNMSELFLTHIYTSVLKDALKTDLQPRELDVVCDKKGCHYI